MPISSPELPGIIQIEVTSRCNLSCPACPRSVPELKSQWISEDLSSSVFERVVSETAAEGRLYHLQGWGEPLLRADLPDLVRAISERGSRASITTNGTLLTDATAGRLIEAGLDSIIFSLGGGTSACHEENRPGTELEQILGKIRMMKELKSQRRSRVPRIVASFQMTRANISTLARAARKARKAGTESVTAINPILVSTPEQENNLVFLDEGASWLRQVRKHLRRASWLSRLLSLPFYHEPAQQTPTAVCREEPRRNLYIGVRGEVSPCVFLNPPISGNIPRRYLGRTLSVERFVLGRVAELSLLEIWNSPRYAGFREAHARREEVELRPNPMQYFLPPEADGGASVALRKTAAEEEEAPLPLPCRSCLRALGF